MRRWNSRFVRVSSRVVLAIAIVIGALAVVPIHKVMAANCVGTSGMTLTRKSSDKFYVDFSRSPALNSAYVAYEIKTDSTKSFNDLWVTIDSFSNYDNLHLSNNANFPDGRIHVGAMPANSTKYVYFYLQSDVLPPLNPDTTPQTYNINYYEGNPSFAAAPFCSQQGSHSGMVDTILAQANKVTSAVVSTPYVGGDITLTIKGQTGTIGSNRTFAYTPATLSSWLPDCYTLKNVQLTMTGGNTGTVNNDLVVTGLNSANTDYTLVYTLGVSCTTTTATPVRPANYISSGTQTKHTDVTSLAYLSIPPVPPAQNTLLLTKSVSPGGSTAGGTANYTLTLTNSAPVPARVDYIEDVLPSGATYQAGSSQYNATAIANPTQPGGNRLVWSSSSFTIPANGTRTLTYDATIPSGVGTYTNSATAYIGTTKIDQTIDTTDTHPATAAYTVVGAGTPDLSTSTKTWTDIEGGDVQPGDQLRYRITLKNTGAVDATGVNVSDTLSPLVENLRSITVTGCGGAYINTSAGNVLTLSALDINRSTNCVITFDVDVVLNAKNYDTILNSATVSTPNEGGSGTTLVSTPAVVRLYPFLSLDKVVNDTDGTINPGQVLTYTVTIHNNGGTDASGVALTDTPNGPVGQLSVASITGCQLSSSSVPMYTDLSTATELNIVNLEVPRGGACTAVYTVTVDAGATAGAQVTNQAHATVASEGGTQPSDATAPTLTVAIPVVATPNLSMSYKGLANITASTVNPGDILRYVIGVKNTGNANATGVSVRDTISGATENLTNISFAQCGMPANSSSATDLIVDNIAVTAGTECVVSFDVTVRSAANQGDIVANTATILPAAEGGLGATATSTSVTVQIPTTDTDNVISTVEATAPNGGDGNNDGIRDSEQSTVTSLPNAVNGNYATLETTGCAGNTAVGMTKASQLRVTDTSYEYPVGLMEFAIICQTPGSTATVTQYFYGNLDASKHVARKYNRVTNTYRTLSSATLTNVTIGGQPALKIVYQITDGGSLDEDGQANGIIVDPVGPAVLVSSSISGTNTSGPLSTTDMALGNTGTNSTMVAIVGSLLVVGAGMILLHRQRTVQQRR